MFEKQVEVEFIKPFSHRIYGNVWEGRRKFLSQKEAQAFIDSGKAVFAEKIKPISEPEQKEAAARRGGRQRRA